LTISNTQNATFANAVTATALSGPLNGTVGATTPAAGTFTAVTATNGRSQFASTSDIYSISCRYNNTTGYYYMGASNSATPDMVFSNNNGTEILRITYGGNLYAGLTGSVTIGSATAPLGEKLNVTSLGSWNTFLYIPNGYNGIGITNTSGTASYNAAVFYNNGTTYSFCGSIGISGTATTYTTSSDYRLKENITPIANALDSVSKLNPVDYTWKFDGSKGQGFIAHELQEICPQAVVGPKDAVDEEGKPKYQSLDTSFLVAMLTKAIQELNAKVDAQAAEIAALKAGA
jgi:hypothetical protein